MLFLVVSGLRITKGIGDKGLSGTGQVMRVACCLLTVDRRPAQAHHRKVSTRMFLPHEGFFFPHIECTARCEVSGIVNKPETIK